MEDMKEQRNKMSDRDKAAEKISKMENRLGFLGKPIKVKKGSRRYLKIIAFSVKSMIGLMLEVRRNRNMPPGAKKRDMVVKELDSALIKATV